MTANIRIKREEMDAVMRDAGGTKFSASMALMGEREAVDREIARLRAALKRLLAAAPDGLDCSDFHHEPEDQHRGDAPECPPLARYIDALAAGHDAALREEAPDA